MALRHEWKHRIDTAGLLALRARLGAVLQRDPHALGGSYQVRSLYFDNLADKALREKLESTNHREKFRLRFYNGDLSLLVLEKKTKTNGLCGKAQTPLTVEEARALLEGRHQELGASSPLLGELRRKMGSQGLQAAAREMGYESRLFDTASVHTIDIVTEDWEGFLETAQRAEYSLCSLVIDGETYENVAIRGKGNTSLTQVEQYGNSRYSFKVEFDHYDNALNYYGLDKLSLNNLIQDNTMLKDYLCYQLMGSFGVDAPLCSFVYITVNGEDWGLYLAVEGVEESFLQRNYGSGYGELYKPDSQSMGGGRGNGGAFSLGDWQQEAAGETSGTAAGSQDTLPAAPDGLEGMGSPPELPSGEGPQEAPGQAAPDSASSATEENPASEAESSSGEGDTSSGEESPSAPEEASGATRQEPPTQPAEGAADAGIEAQPGALGQGQSQASSTTEQWVLLGGSFLALGIGLAVAGLYRRKG